MWFVVLLATGELGHSIPWPETPGDAITEHKKVRCYTENVKVGDGRNYEIEKIRKDEDTIASVERSGRSADCVVHTEITRGTLNRTDTKYLDNPPYNYPNIPSDYSKIPVGFDHPSNPILTQDFGKSIGDGYAIPKIPISINDYGKPMGDGYDSPKIPISITGDNRNPIGGGYDIPKIPIAVNGYGKPTYDSPPNLINDYGERQEFGEEREKSSGSSTSVRRQESYDHQEFSHEKTRLLPGWRPAWGSGEDDPRWRINYETSANDINEVNSNKRLNGNITIILLLQILFLYSWK